MAQSISKSGRVQRILSYLLVVHFTAMILQLCALLAILWWISKNEAKKEGRPNLPPGPIKVPIIGNAEWFFAKFPGRVLFSFGRKYGPISCIKLGKKPIFLLNDLQVWKDAFRRNNLNGRAGILQRMTKNRGILFSDEVREQRKYILKAFRAFADDEKCNWLLEQEITALLQKFESNNGKPVLVETLFAIPTANIVWNMLFGKRINEAVMVKFVDAIKQFTSNSKFFGRKSVLNLIPGLSKLFPTISRSAFCETGFPGVLKTIADAIQEQRNTRQDQEVRNIADDFFDKMQENSTNQNSYFGEGDYQTYFFVDLFFAAIDSTGTTLNWLLMFLATNAVAQSKFQSEIDDVIGSETPNLKFQDKMPYTLAIIQETLRLSAVSILQIHRATEDTQILGYDVPKNSLIIPNNFLLSWDPTIWEEPETFKPERFIDAGKLINSEKITSFGLGKRACVGEGIARKQLFLFAASIFQKFEVKLVGKAPGLDGVFGILHYPKTFSVTFNQRRVT